MAMTSIARIIGSLAEQHPDQPAITCEGRTVTWLELEKRTNRLARAYQRLGVAPDDLVTIALPNGIEFYESALAVWKLGATPQPISARLPQLEREAIVGLADPKVVIGAEPGSLGARATLAYGFVPDPSLPDTPLPDRSARYWKASTSGGSTGRPKIIVSEAPVSSIRPRIWPRCFRGARTWCLGRSITTLLSSSRCAPCSWATTW